MVYAWADVDRFPEPYVDTGSPAVLLPDNGCQDTTDKAERPPETAYVVWYWRALNQMKVGAGPCW